MRFLIIAFVVGGAYTTLKLATKDNKRDIGGVANAGRAEKAINQRRWLQDLATDLDGIDNPTAKKVAQRLREEAYRT